MRLLSQKSTFVLAAATLAVAACAVNESDAPSTAASGIRQLERRAVGPAQPYPADPLTADDEARFATSKRARRELGWHVLAKALAPVKIATPAGATIPLFRTWLGGDEMDRIFGKLYADLGPERRKARDVPSKTELDALFDWNATSLGPSSETDFFERMRQLDDQTKIDGLGGNARVAYSPSYVRHYLGDYAKVADCNLDALSFDTPPASKANLTNCFSREMPSDAVVLKTSWRRNDPIISGLPAIDTSAETLKTVDAWAPAQAPLVPAGPSEAYSVTMSDDAGYSLVGLHLMTKELQHWVWVTVWWSPDGDSDFGQDRPDEITKLGAPWNHYKMCVVTDFDEKDPDPRGGFEGSLGDALAAVHGTNTWCSNPFIEKGAHNAKTNCIGCHQHAGDPKVLAAVLDFPDHGNGLVRQSFPADYSWAFATPASPDAKDRLQDLVKKRIASYASENSAAEAR